MAKIHQLIALVAFALLFATACQRNGFECATDDDCFSNEQCVEGACGVVDGADACVPETVAELCATQTECGMLQLTTRCGNVREVMCGCANNNICEPELELDLCADANAVCGMINADDGCTTRDIDCGPCPNNESCEDNSCVGCDAPVCPGGATCGTVTNACGESVSCGDSCGAEEVCFEYQCTGSFGSPEPETGERFGQQIRGDGEWLVVGAPWHGFGEEGRIYVYRVEPDVIRFHQALENPGVEASNQFGEIIDVRDNRIVAAAGTNLVTFQPDVTGEFRVVSQTTLERRATDIKLMSGDQLAVGLVADGTAPTLFYGTCSAGGCSANDSWAPDPNEIGSLGVGYRLDFDDPYLIAGAPYDNFATDTDEQAEGALYIFAPGRLDDSFSATGLPGLLAFVRNLDYRDFSSDSIFGIGSSVAISAEGYAVSGTPLETPPQQLSEAGSFLAMSPRTDDLWFGRDRFISPSPDAFSRCGQEVELDGLRIWIACVHTGGYGDSLIPVEEVKTEGEIFKFEYDTVTAEWRIQFTETLRQPSGAPYDHYGWAMEAFDGNLFVGAPGRTDFTGRVYVYPIN